MPGAKNELSALHAFCRVVELGSVTAAARALAMPLPTVSRSLQNLERRLGVALLSRTTRALRVTTDGMAFYQRVAPLLVELQDAEQALVDFGSQVRGRLVVSAPASVAQMILAPALADFLQCHSGIEHVEMRSTDRLCDLVADGVDCVIRTGSPEDSRLVARHIVDIPQYFAASPALLAQYGRPQQIEDLVNLPFVDYVFRRRAAPLQVTARCAERSVCFSASHRVSADDGQTYVGMGLAGLGVIEAPAYDINRWLSGGQLELLLPQWHGDLLQFHLMYLYNRHLSRRVRVFSDWASEVLRHPKWREPMSAAQR
jgi:DNA-binding transcriptional LysR family regulator